MKNSVIFLFLAFNFSPSFANQWFGGQWKLESLHCPFGCSDNIKNGFASAKPEAVVFATDKVTLPQIIGMCSSPSKPDWSSVQKTRLKPYLQKWSKNEAALKAPQVRSNLAESIGVQSNPSVSAGLVNCDNGEAFNLIVVDKHKAFLLFEENSYFELSR